MSNYDIMAKKKYLEYLKKLALESEKKEKVKTRTRYVSRETYERK